jgi:ParB-like chromosome segregation protein Spo0J
MIREHGYSVRKLAQKLGKDKGYLENRLRLADAPPEVRELVSVRKDTLSHAYELLKVDDPRKRRRLAEQVGRGELSLVKLRERIEGRRARRSPDEDIPIDDLRPGRDEPELEPEAATEAETDADWGGYAAPGGPLGEDSLVAAKQQLAEAVEDLVAVLRSPGAVRSIPEVDRANLAKYLTIAKLKLENAIAVVRTGDLN